MKWYYKNLRTTQTFIHLIDLFNSLEDGDTIEIWQEILPGKYQLVYTDNIRITHSDYEMDGKVIKNTNKKILLKDQNPV